MSRKSATETPGGPTQRRLAVTLRVAALVAVAVAALVLPARSASADATFNQRILELVNRDRVANGLAPLVADPALAAVAEDAPYDGCLLGLTVLGRAKDMGVRNYFDHKILGCGLLGVTTLLNAAGINLSGSGENIAWMNGTTDPLVAANNLHSQWMSSDGHRRNILNPQWTRIGVGSWRTSPGQTWTGGGYPLTNVFIGVEIFAGGAVTTTTAPPAPVASVSPASLGFGNRVAGTTSDAQTVTVANSGKATLSISSIKLGGTNVADFAIASNGCGPSVAPGGSCSIGIRFTPAAVGARSANLTVSDNASGSPHTVTLSGTGTTPPVPGTPTDVRATGGDGQMSVTWAAPASGTTPVGYGVFAYDAGGYTWKSAWVCATCTNAVVTGLSNGKSYMAVVQGYDGTTWGAGGQSNWTTTAGQLSAPANARSLSGNASLTVAWDLPVNAGGIDGYGVFVYDATGFTGQSAWACATCGTATVSGLTNGRSYYAVLYAHDSRGWGPSSSTTPVVVGTVGPPGNVVAVKGNGSANVSWTPSAAGGAPLAGYGLFVYEGDQYTGVSLWVCATCTTGQVTGLTNGHQYTVRVHGYNAYGWGAPMVSNPVIPS
jgi:uncharacterized protein YkwD